MDVPVYTKTGPSLYNYLTGGSPTWWGQGMRSTKSHMVIGPVKKAAPALAQKLKPKGK